MASSLSGMALIDLFKKRDRNPGTRDTARMGARVPSYLRSPWAATAPEVLVYADIFGDGIDGLNALTRADAMKVPAIATARNRLIEKLAGRPRIDHTPEKRAEKQPTWMTRTDNPLSMSPHQRMLETLDDLIFEGLSLWAVNRDSAGTISEALHVPFGWWSLTPEGEVMFDGKPAPAEQVLLIPGPHRGLLNIAQDTIRGGLDLERAWRARARNPVPNIILQEREDNGMTLEEAKPYVEAVAAARRNPDGAVMYLPYKMNIEIPATGNVDHLESARNAIRLDVAGYFNHTAQGVEASKNQSTLTYENAASEAQQTADRVTFWSEPIEARLSMDDVIPRGHFTRFDFADQNNATTGTPTED